MLAPSSPTGGSSVSAPRSALPPAGYMRAGRSRWKASRPTNGKCAAPVRHGPEGAALDRGVPGRLGRRAKESLRMRYNRLGNSGLAVSELCLGAMTFGNKPGGFFQHDLDQAGSTA